MLMKQVLTKAGLGRGQRPLLYVPFLKEMILRIGTNAAIVMQCLTRGATDRSKSGLNRQLL